MNAQPELVADYECEVGENPLWHPVERKLYWIDILNGRLFRYDPLSGEHRCCYEGGVIGGFTIQSDGSLLLFMEKGAIKAWQDGKLMTLVDEIEEERTTRFNDVIADPAGRVFCGTMPTRERLGRLYRLDTDGTLTKVLEGIGCSNGLAFTLDRSKLYYTDSLTRTIYVFDYDQKSGGLSNQRVFVQTPEGEGVPDGLTVDSAGYVWSARWDGGCLVRYTPQGVQNLCIDFPAKKVSSITFGAADYRDIYVTTAGGTQRALEGSGAGALFRLQLGIEGLPEYFSTIRLPTARSQGFPR